MAVGAKAGKLLLIGLLLPVSLTLRADASSPYFNLIGVGCVPWRDDGSSLTWRPELPGIPQQESIRIFKYFESSEMRRCLALIVEADPSLAVQAHLLGPTTEPAKFSQVLSGIHRQWKLFGVDDALEEVATSGQPGPSVNRLLARCDNLQSSSATTR